MLSKRKKLEIASIGLALISLVSAAIAMTYFTKQMGAAVTIVGDWTITVSPETLDFGNLGMNEEASRSVTLTYVGNKPSAYIYWNSTEPTGMTLTATFDGTPWTEISDHRNLARNTPVTVVFTLNSGDALAGDYDWIIYVNSGDS